MSLLTDRDFAESKMLSCLSVQAIREIQFLIKLKMQKNESYLLRYRLPNSGKVVYSKYGLTVNGKMLEPDGELVYYPIYDLPPPDQQAWG